ncbi:hypothetical protein ZIOFF_026452 [Zingiber officinale]|uniref:Uncharacterized protein n=1 Tax=Zingiber officinale TaxID=94328 RepID=A0A8J5HGM7_ZINOF|nr:hypothetical protein ZIOFF_026452 [Zingiber officinale]
MKTFYGKIKKKKCKCYHCKEGHYKYEWRLLKKNGNAPNFHNNGNDERVEASYTVGVRELELRATRQRRFQGLTARNAPHLRAAESCQSFSATCAGVRNSGVLPEVPWLSCKMWLGLIWERTATLLITNGMSSNSGFTVTYSSSIYLCFGCELDLASTAQLIFRFIRSSSIRSLMRNSIGHMECEDFRSIYKEQFHQITDEIGIGDIDSRMSSNSGFTVTYSSSIYLCFGCELDLASTAQLIFRFIRSSSIRSLMRNSIGHMECEDFILVLGILIQGKLCVEFWLYFYEYL